MGGWNTRWGRGSTLSHNRTSPRMDEVRGHITRLFRYKRAQAYGIGLGELHERIQSRVPFHLRKDYLTLAIVGKQGPYMFDAELRRVYYTGGDDAHS